MKKEIAIIVALLWGIIVCAQKTEAFDIATYKVPKGWKKSIKQGMVSYSVSNEAKRNYCIINIYASITSSGTTEEEFNKAWNDLAARPLAIEDAPQKDTAADDQGREAITGAGGFVKGSLTGIAMLTVYVGFGRTTCVLTLTNDESYYKTIEIFLGALTLAKTAPPKPVTATVGNQKPATQGNINTFHNTNKLEGVWNGMNIDFSNFNINSTGAAIWLTFFDNGRVYSTLPDDMGSFNKNASDIGYYQISNTGASLQWFKGTASTAIQFIEKDKIKVIASTGDQTYGRCKPVDGARLEGAWTTFSNTRDPELDAPGIKPQIHLSKNGRFTDDGIFMTAFNNVKTAPGSGTYSLNNFTLTLKYDNGTTRKASFTGFFSNDVTVNSSVLYIDRKKFRKR